MVVVMMVVVRVAMMVVRNDVAGKFMSFTYGLSYDRCDGSSSKNECNRKFDLSHFFYE